MDERDFKFDSEAAKAAEQCLTANEQNKDFIDVKVEDKVEVEQNEAKQEAKTETVETKRYELGKFKDPSELMKAYKELEKEFTKRSQRIKELENASKPYESEEEWRDAADKFFKKTPSAKALAKDIAYEIALDPALKQSRDCFDKALLRVLVKSYRSPEQIMEDGQFLKNYALGSEEVKKAVIENYLRDIGATAPPLTLSRGGQSCAAPLKKPRSVKEAGDMLLRENK